MDGWSEAAAGRKLTYDDFVHFPDDGLRHELIDGVHYVTAAPSTRHQRIQGRLQASLFVFVEAAAIGEVFTPRFQVVLSNYDVVEPDVSVILTDQASILTPQHARGAPAIVVEILSPGTRKRDQTLKRDLYERSGVREYWTIDPDRDVIVLQRCWSSTEQCVTLRRGAGQFLTSPLLPGWQLAVDELLAG
jgi:Uma2 family endonuclease